MGFQYANSKLHDNAQDGAGPDPQQDGPGMGLLRTTLSQHVRDPKRVVDLLDAFPGEHDQMIAFLH